MLQLPRGLNTIQSTDFAANLNEATLRTDSLVCVGLDSDPVKLPHAFARMDPAEAIIAFNREIVQATSDLVCAYKPNFAFYIRYGSRGVEALLALRDAVPSSIPIILDAKVGDIANSSEEYAATYLDNWQFDALTVNPYMGGDSLAPFLERAGKGIFVLCKTSNPGSIDFQDLPVMDGPVSASLFDRVARSVAGWDSESNATVGLVAGAPFPEQLVRIRTLCPDQIILMPGTGTQAGDLERAVIAGIDSRGRGLVVNASRSILYASSGSDYGVAARAATDSLRRQINEVRNTVIERPV